jgi:hypothetical protein
VSTAHKEALRECCLHLAGAHQQIEEMEQLIAQGLAASQRGERLGVRWQRHADTVLKLLRQDAEERAEA